MGGSSVSAPTAVPLGTQFQSLASGIQSASPGMQALDAQADPQYAYSTSQAQGEAAANWGANTANSLLPWANANTQTLENSANAYTAQAAPGVMSTYMNNNPALQGALQGSLAMAGGGSYTMGGTPGSAATSPVWNPGTPGTAATPGTPGTLGAPTEIAQANMYGYEGTAVNGMTPVYNGQTQALTGDITNGQYQSFGTTGANGVFPAMYQPPSTGGTAATAGTPGSWSAGTAATPGTPGTTTNVAPAQSLLSLMGTGNTLTGLGQMYAGQGVQEYANAQQLQGYAQSLQGDPQSPLLQQQNLQSQQELATNGRLSNQEMSTIQQQTAGQFSSSGMGGSSANIADQALSLEQAQNARLQQYQANAGMVQGENVASTAANSAAYANAAGAANNAFGNVNNMAGVVGGMETSAGNIFGEAGQLQNQANSNLFSIASLMQSPIANLQNSYLSAATNYGTQAMQAGVNTSLGSQQISPQEIQTMADYYNTQYNAQAAAGVANAQGQSASQGSMIAGGAAIGASVIGGAAIIF